MRQEVLWPGILSRCARGISGCKTSFELVGDTPCGLWSCYFRVIAGINLRLYVLKVEIEPERRRRSRLVSGSSGTVSVLKVAQAGFNAAVWFIWTRRWQSRRVFLKVLLIFLFSNLVSARSAVIVVCGPSSLSDLTKIPRRNLQAMRVMIFRTSVCMTTDLAHSDRSDPFKHLCDTLL